MRTSTGTWLGLAAEAQDTLQPLAAKGELDRSPGCLPWLFAVFHEPGRTRRTFNAVHRLLAGDGFVHWRNTVFGHGVFEHDRAWYAAEVKRWLPHLHALSDALGPAIEGWRLVARAADGDAGWHGCTTRGPCWDTRCWRGGTRRSGWRWTKLGRAGVPWH